MHVTPERKGRTDITDNQKARILGENAEQLLNL